MIEDLIVIPTNNGYKHLDKLLKSIHTDCPILIIDTGSTDEEHLDYVINAKCLNVDLNLLRPEQTPFKGYACGAKLWAYWKHPANNYLFLQDSLEVIEQDFLEQFKEKFSYAGRGAAAWTSFDFEFDPGLQEQAMRYMYGDFIPKYGIFGPIFYTSRDTLEFIDRQNGLPAYPVHAHQSQGLERGWAMIFEKYGLPVEFIHNLPNVTLTASGLFGPFRKSFLKRG